MLEALGEDLWVVKAPLRLLGADFGTRMTVVRCPDGSLLLISPCKIDDRLASQLAERGRVCAILAPNAFHHFFLLAASERYPQATCFLADGVEAKLDRRPAAQTRPLGRSPEVLWQGVLEHVLLEGAPRVNEVVLFHTASKTLILTDLCFHFSGDARGWTGLLQRLLGVHGRLAVSRILRSLIRDREAARRSCERILQWPFERIVVTHGELVDREAHRRFEAAVAML